MNTLYVIAATVLLALGIIGVQQLRIVHYRHYAAALQGVANTLHDANQTNIATIADLQHANAAWATKYAADVAAATKAAQDAKSYAETQHNAASAAQQALKHAYKTEPKTGEWASVPVPDTVVRVLTKNSGAN